MRDTQLAKPNPLRKKMAAMAARAWDFETGLEAIWDRGGLRGVHSSVFE
jgi:hypothetical protein